MEDTSSQKVVDVMLQEVLTTNQVLHILNKVDFYNTTGFDCDQDLGEPLTGLQISCLQKQSSEKSLLDDWFHASECWRKNQDTKYNKVEIRASKADSMDGFLLLFCALQFSCTVPYTYLTLQVHEKKETCFR